MSLRPMVALLLLACMAPAVHAETADEIIARFEAARGGDKWKAVQSVRMTGKMMMGPMEAPFTMELQRPKQWRLDFVLQGMTGTQAFDGEKGWMSMPFTGKKDAEPLPEEATKEMSDQADFDGPLTNYKDKGNTVELLGKEAVEGADAWKLKVTTKAGTVRTMFIDAETYLPIREESKRSMRGQEIEAVTSLGDYKEVEGVVLAHSMEMMAKGAPQGQRMTFDTIELNPKFEAARFTMPAPADTSAAAADKAPEAAEKAKDKAKDAAKAAKPAGKD